MSLPTGAISMNDICLAYGRGAAGYSGFQNYYPYALGEYYRGGIYVPVYDPGGPFGAQSQSQSNVDMNTLRGTQALTYFSTITNTSNGAKFASYGYATAGDGSFGLTGATVDTQAGNFKCYGTQLASIYYTPLTATLYLRVYGNLQNSGWYSLAIIAATAGDYTNNIFLASAAATFVTTASISGVPVTQFSWGTSSPSGIVNPLPVLGNQYQIKVRRTANY